MIFRSLLFCLFLFCCLPLKAQYFLSLIDHPATGYYQRMAQFDNRDVLLVDAPQSAIAPFSHRGFYMMRMDTCGYVVWANSYHNNGRHLNFDQVKISNNDEIYAFGSELIGQKEEIFVAKIDGGGEQIAYRTFDGATEDHFTYSLDLKEDRLLVSGTVFNLWPDITDHYFVMQLDLDLNIIYDKKYRPYEAYGEAILTNDQGALFISGNRIVKTDELGEMVWTKRMEFSPYFIPTFIPLELPDGYVFALHWDGFSWFFKLDISGNLLWQSDKIPSHYEIPNMALMEDGNIIAIYHRKEGGRNKPAYLILNVNGEILDQQALEADFDLNTGFISISEHNQRINLFGNVEMDFTAQHSNSDFLMQFELGESTGDCFYWEAINEREENTDPFPFSDSLTVAENALVEIDSSQLLEIQTLDFNWEEICREEIPSELTKLDTTISCEESWEVYLPVDFTWLDGNSDNPRELFEPGIYGAQRLDCLGEFNFEYQLKKASCDCRIQFPNSISPNADGLNDHFELFSNCDLIEVRLSIYNRWGESLFQTDDINQLEWDAYMDGTQVSAGIYIVQMKGQAINALGEIHYFEENGILNIMY